MSAELLADLTRVKAVFQLRAISAAIGLPASGIETRRAETGTGSVVDESPARRETPLLGAKEKEG